MPKPKPIAPLPANFVEWKDAAKNDAQGVGKALFTQIESLPHTARTAVFASLRSHEDVSRELLESTAKKSAPFAGVPFLLKDLFDYPGLPTAASSSFLSGLRGIPTRESALSQTIRSHGGTLIGKTHLNEFAYGLSGENAHYGHCPHPIFPKRLSGGSSSGSAYAVAKEIVPLATGTDTGGSIRVPAAWCGIYGIRLSPNQWSRNGCFPLSPSFDTAGWFCKSAENMAYSLKALLALKPSRSKKTPIGLSLIDSKQLAHSPLNKAYLDTVEKLGVENDPSAQAAFWKSSINAAQHYTVLQSIEAYQTHKSWLDDFRNAYHPVVWKRFDQGRHWNANDIDSAKETEAAIQIFFKTALENYDYLVLPATWSPAISAKQHTLEFRTNLLSLCAPGSLARNPILTVPVCNAKGESGGLQIIYKDNASDLPLRILSLLDERQELAGDKKRRTRPTSASS